MAHSFVARTAEGVSPDLWTNHLLTLCFACIFLHALLRSVWVPLEETQGRRCHLGAY